MKSFPEPRKTSLSPVGRSVGGSLLRHSPTERKTAADGEAAAFVGKVRFGTSPPHNRVDYATRWPSLWDVIISAFAHLPPSQSPSTFPVSSHKRYVMPH
ncbi:MAG: hypothetical protein WAX69_19860 [Victivallales bacterium]